MRKIQKQQLLEVIKSLHLLHQEIKDRFVRKEYQTVQTALSDCQEAAIQVGEAIEQMVGTETEAVVYLEKYCEKLYQVNVQLKDIQAQKAYKLLEGILIKAENAINHMPVRKEVVFFPYKASMWDSLESVYLSLKEDKSCDAYVVPIPYYDKRVDGSLGEMHYEGNEYPKNIDITDYRNYNLEERHPDIVYIHNPYDEWNNVTCVPERYFSRNLCHHTDCLVYIPYFVLGEPNADNQNEVDDMKHFCFLPGIIYSHKVIVQSENMRQIYINEYIKAAKPLGLPAERKILEEKILGLGSPKIDKVRNTRKEDLEIPEEWLNVIKKPDGTWKKIVFYNTSINALLRFEGQILEKMKNVFRIFKEYQDEVVLLWRPHPLIPNTIKSMRPQLWTEYVEIVDEYRKEGWGIYDDSADMDRAVVLCDVYYGDHSSVMVLAKSVNKIVLLQSLNINTNKIDNMMEWAIKYNGKLIFSVMEFNGICSFDLKKNVINVECNIKDLTPVMMYRSYLSGKQKDNKVIMVPLMADKVTIYDLQSKHYEYIELPQLDDESLKHQKCSGVIIHDDEIYLLPKTVYYPYIVQINLQTKQIEVYGCQKYLRDQIVFCNAMTEVDEQKFFFCLHGFLYEFIYETKEINEIPNISNGKIKGLFIEQKEIYVLEDKVIIYDDSWNIINEIDFKAYGVSCDEELYRIYRKGHYLYLYSNYSTHAKQIYRIDMRTKECKSTDLKEKNDYFISLVTDEESICFVYYMNGKINVIDEELIITEHKVNMENFNINHFLHMQDDWCQKVCYGYNETEVLLNKLTEKSRDEASEIV